jgi:hypothetical protein
MPTSSQTALTVEQLLALSSPVRVSLFGALRLLGPQSIKSLAAYLNARPDALYYHVRMLQAVGVIEVKELRPVHKRKEAVYGLAAPQYTISSFEGDAEYAQAVMGLVEASTAYALAGFRKASANLEGPEPEFHLVHGRLRPENYARWKIELEETIRSGFQDEGEEAIPVIACTMVMPLSQTRPG